MPTKYDYGTLAKAAPRLLKPHFNPLGFQQLKGGCFVRDRGDWQEGFFLQATAYGGGDFCVNVGINVPQMDELWLTPPEERHFGLLIWARLGPNGVDGDYWFPAANRAELTASIDVLAAAWPHAEAWLATMGSLQAIRATLYDRITLAQHDPDSRYVLDHIKWGFISLLTGDHAEATRWLSHARDQYRQIVAEHEAAHRRRKPGKESLGFYQSDCRHLLAVESALARLAGTAA